MLTDSNFIYSYSPGLSHCTPFFYPSSVFANLFVYVSIFDLLNQDFIYGWRSRNLRHQPVLPRHFPPVPSRNWFLMSTFFSFFPLEICIVAHLQTFSSSSSNYNFLPFFEGLSFSSFYFGGSFYSTFLGLLLGILFGSFFLAIIYS